MSVWNWVQLIEVIIILMMITFEIINNRLNEAKEFNELNDVKLTKKQIAFSEMISDLTSNVITIFGEGGHGKSTIIREAIKLREEKEPKKTWGLFMTIKFIISYPLILIAFGGMKPVKKIDAMNYFHINKANKLITIFNSGILFTALTISITLFHNTQTVKLILVLTITSTYIVGLFFYRYFLSNPIKAILIRNLFNYKNKYLGIENLDKINDEIQINKLLSYANYLAKAGFTIYIEVTFNEKINIAAMIEKITDDIYSLETYVPKAELNKEIIEKNIPIEVENEVANLLKFSTPRTLKGYFNKYEQKLKKVAKSVNHKPMIVNHIFKLNIDLNYPSIMDKIELYNTCKDKGMGLECLNHDERILVNHFANPLLGYRRANINDFDENENLAEAIVKLRKEYITGSKVDNISLKAQLIEKENGYKGIIDNHIFRNKLMITNETEPFKIMDFIGHLSTIVREDNENQIMFIAQNLVDTYNNSNNKQITEGLNEFIDYFNCIENINKPCRVKILFALGIEVITRHGQYEDYLFLGRDTPNDNLINNFVSSLESFISKLKPKFVQEQFVKIPLRKDENKFTTRLSLLSKKGFNLNFNVGYKDFISSNFNKLSDDFFPLIFESEQDLAEKGSSPLSLLLFNELGANNKLLKVDKLPFTENSLDLKKMNNNRYNNNKVIINNLINEGIE